MMLENLYYICAGPVLVIVALFGLKQIRALRDQTEQSERQHLRLLARDADSRAVDLSDRYLVEVLPDLGKLASRLAPLRRGEWADVIGSGPQFDWARLMADESLQTRFAVQLTALVDPDLGSPVLNKLEFIALQFNRGVASDSLGQRLLRDGLLEAVMVLWPLIAKIRAASPQAYSELIELYGRWSSAQQAGGTESSNA